MPAGDSWRARRRRVRMAALARMRIAASSTPATPASEDGRACLPEKRAGPQPRGEQGVIRDAIRAAAASEMGAGLQPRCERHDNREASKVAGEMRAGLGSRCKQVKHPTCEQGKSLSGLVHRQFRRAYHLAKIRGLRISSVILSSIAKSEFSIKKIIVLQIEFHRN